MRWAHAEFCSNQGKIKFTDRGRLVGQDLMAPQDAYNSENKQDTSFIFSMKWDQRERESLIQYKWINKQAYIKNKEAQHTTDATRKQHGGFDRKDILLCAGERELIITIWEMERGQLVTGVAKELKAPRVPQTDDSDCVRKHLTIYRELVIMEKQRLAERFCIFQKKSNCFTQFDHSTHTFVYMSWR